MIDLFKIKEDFSFLVKEAEPWTLTQFVMWLDLKLSEFKTKGYMILDHNIKTKPKWLQEERLDAEVAPAPAPCRTCHTSKSSVRDVGQYYSEIHASPPVHQQNRSNQNTSHQNAMDDSDNIRGEVGIIDLSHGELQGGQMRGNVPRQNTSQGSAIGSNFRKGLGHTAPKQRNLSTGATQMKNKPEIIEIDGSSPSEKMFSSYRPEIGRTSTPMVRKAGQLLQKAKNRQALSMGTAIYTSTTTSLTPTFSSSYNRQSSAPSSSYTLGAPPASSASFALGAPPVSSTAFSMSTSINTQALDELISQTVQSVSGPPVEQHSKGSIPQIQTSLQDTSSNIQGASPNVFPGMSISPNTFSSMGDGHAVPVALHANIDNISRDLSASQSSAVSNSSSTEIKMETDAQNVSSVSAAGDSFNSSSLSTQALDTSANNSQSQTLPDSLLGPLDDTGIPRPGLVDPQTAKAYQMVELVAGSGVYVYDKTISQAFKVGTERDTGTYSGEKMARYLLNVFWSRKDLVGATLSKTGRGKKILNQQIIEAILDFCLYNGRHNKSTCRDAIYRSLTARTFREKERLKKKFQQFQHFQLEGKFFEK